MKPAHRHQLERDTGTGTPSAETPAPSPPDLARRAALGDFAPDVLAWLSDSFRRHLVDGKEIESALRLDRASRKRGRDDALRAAAALLTLGSDDAWPVAGRLAQAVARHHRLRDAPSTPLERAVAQAFAYGEEVPVTQRHLYRIIGPAC